MEKVGPLLLWYLQEQGISRLSTVSDGGRAIQEALSQVQGKSTINGMSGISSMSPRKSRDVLIERVKSEQDSFARHPAAGRTRGNREDEHEEDVPRPR